VASTGTRILEGLCRERSSWKRRGRGVRRRRVGEEKEKGEREKTAGVMSGEHWEAGEVERLTCSQARPLSPLVTAE
jgi:hypothetical protein